MTALDLDAIERYWTARAHDIERQDSALKLIDECRALAASIQRAAMSWGDCADAIRAALDSGRGESPVPEARTDD